MKSKLLFFCLMALVPLVAMSQTIEDDEVVSSEQVEQFSEDYTGFIVPDLDFLARVIDDPTSPFFYPSLVDRFAEADTTLTIGELHCLYYGSMLREGYNPYSQPDDLPMVREILNQTVVPKKDAVKAIKLLDKMIEQYPVHLPLYNYRYYARSLVSGEDSKAAEDDAYRYISLIDVIVASGSGVSFETAIHVVMVSHSYDVMSYYGLEPVSQSLAFNDSIAYDVFELNENELEMDELYVNVDKCFNFLRNKFNKVQTSLVSDKLVDEIVIPLGHKVTVKLEKKQHQGIYRFRVIADELIFDTINISDDSQSYFPKNDEGEDNTIIFYCVPSSWGDGISHVSLMMKSFYGKILSYDTYISTETNPNFVTTSNVGIMPKVVGEELWADPVTAIKIGRFRPMKK